MVTVFSWHGNKSTVTEQYTVTDEDCLSTQHFAQVVNNVQIDETHNQHEVAEADRHSMCVPTELVYIKAHTQLLALLSPNPHANLSLPSLNVRSVYTAYGTTYLCTLQGEVFAWGNSSSGQCGIIADFVKEPRQISFQNYTSKCVHGHSLSNTSATDHSLLHAGLVCATETSALAISLDGCSIWQWGALFMGDQPFEHPQPIVALQGRQILSIAAGHAHYVVLASQQAKNSSYNALVNFRRSECVQCALNNNVGENRQEEHDLRLSALMASAHTSKLRRHKPAHSSSDSNPSPFHQSTDVADLEDNDLTTVEPSADRQLSLASLRLDLSTNDSLEQTQEYCIQPSTIQSACHVVRRQRISSQPERYSFVERPSHMRDDLSQQSDTCDLSDVQDEMSNVDVFSNDGAEESAYLGAQVWSWGLNTMGQLGHGDFVKRREPCLVEHLNDCSVLKVSAGDKHSTALTATGKVGSQSSVLDMAAFGESTMLLVNACDNQPLLYYCGKDLNNIQESRASVTTRLNEIDVVRHVWHIFMAFFQNMFGLDDCDSSYCTNKASCIVGVSASGGSALAFGCDKHTIIHLLLDSLFDEMKFCRDLQKLLGFVDQLTEKVTQDWCVSILTDYSTSLRQLQCTIQSNVLQLRCILQETAVLNGVGLSVMATLCACWGSALRQQLQVLHSIYVRAVTANVFMQLQQISNCYMARSPRTFSYSDNLLDGVACLSLDYDTDSRKAHKQCKKLLQLPLQRVNEYSVLLRRLTESLNTESEREAVMREFHAWKVLQQILLNVSLLADRTLQHWTNCEQLNGLNLVEDRFVHKLYSRASDSDWLSTVTIEGTVDRHWTHVLLASDSLIINYKKAAVEFKYPLVWLSPPDETCKTDVSDNAVKVLCPDCELTFAFNTNQAKNEFVQIISQTLLQHQAGGVYSNPPLNAPAPAMCRRGTHSFNQSHCMYPGATYDGLWLLAKPHRRGKLTWPNKDEYIGRFDNGHLHGTGHMNRPDEGIRVDGTWKLGQLHGLAIIDYVTCKAQYEGFTRANMRHGHGVYRCVAYTYAGNWLNDKRHGYGVMSTQREKYLGEWVNDQEHGQGTLVTIDGVYYEAVFDNAHMTNASMSLPDGIKYVGEMNGRGKCKGKGVLYLVNGDTIDGQFEGSLLQGELSICNQALYRRPTVSYESPTKEAIMARFDQHPVINGSFVPGNRRWQDIFDAWFEHVLLIDVESEALHEADVVWSALAAACCHRTTPLCSPSKRSATSSARVRRPSVDVLERIPPWDQPWGELYVSMVIEYCEQAFSVQWHALGRLMDGICKVFQSSYLAVAEHALVQPQATAELASLITRLYALLRLLFPALPCDVTIKELCDEHKHNSMGDSEHTASMQHTNQLHVAVRQWLCAQMYNRCYATVFTLYQLHCARTDHLYWQRITLWNAKTDVALLDAIGVERKLWPIELSSRVSELDTPLVCATAKAKYYASAIQTLQKMSCETSPHAKLQVIKDTFTEITRCVRNNTESTSSNGTQHTWCADSIMPVVIYVCVRAQLQRLGAEMALIRDATGDQVHGVTDYQFQTLLMSYLHLVDLERAGRYAM